MNKLTVTNLVDFNRMSTRSKQTLVKSLKKPPKLKAPDEDDGGGNYWVSALSCLAKTFLQKDNELLLAKIEELLGKIHDSNTARKNNTYQRNISILENFEDYDFCKLKPSATITPLKKSKDISILTLKNLQLSINPHHVYTYKDNQGVQNIGAIWFAAKLDGLDNQELSLITDLLYRYLKTNFSDNYKIVPEYCIAIDVITVKKLAYSQILTGEIESPLLAILEEIKKMS